MHGLSFVSREDEFVNGNRDVLKALRAPEYP